MSEYYKETHNVAVTFIEPTYSGGYAEVRTPTYPDGMVKNDLSPAELREVAEMLNQAADDLEERLPEESDS